MAVAILIFLLFLEPILSEQYLSWDEYKKINLVKRMTMNEINHRRNIYLENLAKIQKHNDRFRKGLETYSLVMNEFGHLTEKEFLMKYTGYKDDIKKNWDGEKDLGGIYEPPKHITLPEAVDWRLKGVVTQVKSQSGCGACYAFGSVAAIESQYSIRHKKLVELSEQQIIDCSRNKGCKGGYLAFVYEYVRDVGLTTKALYPYEAQASQCRLHKHEIVVKLKQSRRVNPKAIRNLQGAVALLGPVTIAVNTSKWQFLSAKEILIGDWCGASAPFDHVLSVVGYNTTKEGISYWIIKNSWGPRWGDQGYVYLEHTKADKCGVAQLAVIPQLIE